MTTSYWHQFEKNQKKISNARFLAKSAGLALGRALYFAGIVAPLVIEGIKLVPLAHNPATLPLALVKFSLETCHVAYELKRELFEDSDKPHISPSKKRS